jgi:hypothetical protein
MMKKVRLSKSFQRAPNAPELPDTPRLGFERRYLNDQLKRELKEVRKSNWYSERIRWFQFISAAVLKIGTLYYSLSLWSQGKIAAADFVVATSLSLLIISEARNLSKRFLEFFEHIGNVANGVNTIIQPHEIIDRDNAINHAITKGSIEFRQVHFGYSSEKTVFTNLSVTIQPGASQNLALALAQIGDYFPKPETLYSFDSSFSKAGILISDLIQRLDTFDAKFKLCQDILQVAEPISFATECFRWMRIIKKNEEKDEESLFSESALKSLAEIVVNRIRNTAVSALMR